MKKEYIEPEICIDKFTDVDDVLTTSGDGYGNGNDTDYELPF